MLLGAFYDVGNLNLSFHISVFFWMVFKELNAQHTQDLVLSLGGCCSLIKQLICPIDRFIRTILKFKPPRFPVSK